MVCSCKHHTYVHNLVSTVFCHEGGYLSNHVINESVLIPDACLLILVPVVRLIHVCKDLQEAAVVYLQNGVFCGQVKRPAQRTDQFECALNLIPACMGTVMQHSQQMQSTATGPGDSVSNG